MRTADLARELGIPPEAAADIPAPRRAALERMIEAAEALNRGERPPGVIVCNRRKR